MNSIQSNKVTKEERKLQTEAIWDSVLNDAKKTENNEPIHMQDSNSSLYATLKSILVKAVTK